MSIHGPGDDLSAPVAAAFLVGFIAGAMVHAFPPERLLGRKWLATALMVLSRLIVPRFTTSLPDIAGAEPPKAVEQPSAPRFSAA